MAIGYETRQQHATILVILFRKSYPKHHADGLFQIVMGAFGVRRVNYYVYTISQKPLPCSLMVRIAGFHPAGPGSIPGRGNQN